MQEKKKSSNQAHRTSHSKKSTGIFYFINLQDIDNNSTAASDTQSKDFKILKLQKNQKVGQAKDSKMVFDVFNRNLYNSNPATSVTGGVKKKEKKSTWSKSRSKKKNSNVLVLSNYYQNQRVSKQTELQKIGSIRRKKQPNSLKSSSFSSNYYRSNMLTVCKTNEEASSSRIFRMDSFLTNIEKLAKSAKKPKKADTQNTQNKKKKFFPNQTLMATCNKIFDICKLDNSAGIFKLNKTTRNEIQLFNKTKIRKKIRDNVFSFRRTKKIVSPLKGSTSKMSIMAPSDFSQSIEEPIGVSKSQVSADIKHQQKPLVNSYQSIGVGGAHYAELNQLSSKSEIYWNQKIQAIESTRNSDADSLSSATDEEVLQINGGAETLQEDEADRLSVEEDECNVYSECSLVTTNEKRKETCYEAIERGSALTNDSGQIKYLNIIVHRLPGEKLGMQLRVEDTGHIVVVSVVENGAADRASDLHGNSCPIKALDCIVEINGVSLHIMKHEDLLSIVQELPLYVQLTLYRTNRAISPSLSLASPNEGNSIFTPPSTRNVSPDTAANNVPMGYNLHTVYLSSLEAKCITPCDLIDSEDKVNGYFKIQRSTLQIANEDDHLKKNDILYNINGEQLLYKNKFDLCSMLSSLGGIAEVTVLRKSPGQLFNTSDYEVPYYNSIFAQNSIKLAMRKYENPASKSGSDAEFLNTDYKPDQVHRTETETQIDTMISENLTDLETSAHTMHYQKTLADSSLPHLDPHCLDDKKSEHYNDLINSLNGQLINSLHKGNWIFLNKRQCAPLNLDEELTNRNISTPGNKHHIKSHLDDIQTRVAEKLEQSLKNQSIRSFTSDTNKLRDYSDFFLDNLFSPNENQIEQTYDKLAHQKKDSINSTMISASARSLTSSSCHSERSIAHLNCLTFETDVLKVSPICDSIELNDVNLYATIEDEFDTVPKFESLKIELQEEVMDSSELSDEDSIRSVMSFMCGQVEKEQMCADTEVADLLSSMVGTVEHEINMERDIYKLLVDLVNEIEIKCSVENEVDASCEYVESFQSLMDTFEEINKPVNVDQVVEHVEDVVEKEDEDITLKNTSLSNGLNKIVKNDEELCSLKKLIHEELKELIKSKSNTDNAIDLSIYRQPNTKSDSTIQIQPVAKAPTKLPPAEIDSDNEVLRITHILPKTKLKSTMQNFLQKQKPTVIYNSNTNYNHRNMQHTPPPPIPSVVCHQTPPALRKTLSASYNNACSTSQDRINFKSYMKDTYMVFDSVENKPAPKDDEKSEVVKFTLPLLNDEFSSNLIAARAFSTTQLNSPPTKKSEPSFDYVKSAIEKQTKQRPLKSRQHLSNKKLSFARSVSPLTRKKITTDTFTPIQTPKTKPDSSTNPSPSDPKPTAHEKEANNTDNLCASSVKEKIMIFTKNPIFANQSSKPSINRVKKATFNATASYQAKPRPLSQVILENKHHKSNETNSSIITNALKFTTPSKVTTNKLPAPVEPAFTKKQPNSKYSSAVVNSVKDEVISLNLKQSQDLPIKEGGDDTEKTFKSVKEKIAYFSSKLYMEKSNKNQSRAKSPARKCVKSVEKLEALPPVSCSIESKLKLTENNSCSYSESTDSVHYASYHNLSGLNVIYNQVSSVKYGEVNERTLNELPAAKKANWKMNVNLSKKPNGGLKDFKMVNACNENKISSLIENLETKWKHHGLNN